MTTITAKAGEVIQDGSYPPTMFCVSGTAVILKIDHPDETIEILRTRSIQMKNDKYARKKRLAKRLGKM